MCHFCTEARKKKIGASRPPELKESVSLVVKHTQYIGTRMARKFAIWDLDHFTSHPG